MKFSDRLSDRVRSPGRLTLGALAAVGAIALFTVPGCGERGKAGDLFFGSKPIEGENFVGPKAIDVVGDASGQYKRIKIFVQFPDGADPQLSFEQTQCGDGAVKSPFTNEYGHNGVTCTSDEVFQGAQIDEAKQQAHRAIPAGY